MAHKPALSIQDLEHWTYDHRGGTYTTSTGETMPDHRWGGWVWTIVRPNGHTARYRTDGEGSGLWQIMPNGEHRQELGTCQFSLSRDRKRAYSAIRRFFLS